MHKDIVIWGLFFNLRDPKPGTVDPGPVSKARDCSGSLGLSQRSRVPMQWSFFLYQEAKILRQSWDAGTVPKTQSPNTGFISQSQRPKACDSPKTLGLTVTEARESPDFKVFDTMLSAPLIVVIFSHILSKNHLRQLF